MGESSAFSRSFASEFPSGDFTHEYHQAVAKRRLAEVDQGEKGIKRILEEREVS